MPTSHTQFYAHSANEQGEMHSLSEHLSSVAEIASIFAEPFHGHEFAYYAGLWHDLGKFTPHFQKYLKGDSRSGGDHKGAGASFALSENHSHIALLVQGHHGGLRDYYKLKSWVREKEGVTATADALQTARRYIPELYPKAPVEYPDFARRNPLRTEMFFRMVFSALVDADSLDTEGHSKPYNTQTRTNTESIAQLWERFQSKRITTPQEEKGSINLMRERIFKDCVAAAEQPKGIFKLAAPTGSGKTLSSMGFALSHAIKHDMERVIVAVPYISITQQTAQVYRDVVEETSNDSRVILEHHSMAAENEPEEYDKARRWDRLAAENWDAPIIVTTTVQLLESLFSNRRAKTRKLHNIANSVIILDEVQSLPPYNLTPILDVIKDLSENYGCSVVLCTATQPTFQEIEIFRDTPAQDILNEPDKNYQKINRVRYEWRIEPGMNWDEVAELMRSENQALAVVNTKKDALALLDALDDRNALHLSTMLCGKHRSDVMNEVKRRLKNGEDCRVVSTQVVEAGVDLDFPTVLRAIGPLDRILQAAGRCNRNGNNPEGKVIVFSPKEQSALPQGYYSQAVEITLQMLKGNIDIEDPAFIRRYFRKLYKGMGHDDQKVQDYRKKLNYPEVSRRFRMIDDDTVPVIVTGYGTLEERDDAKNILIELQNNHLNLRDSMRRAQPWIVQVYHYKIGEMSKDGTVTEIREGIYQLLGTYDDVIGIGGVKTPDPDLLIV